MLSLIRGGVRLHQTVLRHNRISLYRGGVEHVDHMRYLSTAPSFASEIDASTTDNNDPTETDYFEAHQITIRGMNIEEVDPILNFDDTMLAAPLKKALKQQGFDAPTPIQATSWPIIAQNKRDLISVARTGSGKTLGFLMPALQQLLESQPAQPPKHRADRRKRRKYRPPRVLVLAPTRELTQQIGAEARKYHLRGTINTTEVYGGAGKHQQIRDLRSGIDVVIATPGRCNDLCEMGELDLSEIEYLVLDEADRMLDMGFEPQIRSIIDQIPTAPLRQTVFFTATWPKEVQQMALEYLTNPVQVSIGEHDVLNANKAITQQFHIMKPFRKEDFLFDLLENTISVVPDRAFFPRTIIFVNRKADAEELSFSLRREGYFVRALHGDKTQSYRTGVLESFRSGKCSILIATDVAARGLDVKEIQHVINYDFPADGVESYVHRIGRTARGESAGTSHTILTPMELRNEKFMSDLVGLLKRAEQSVPDELIEATRRKERSTSRGINRYSAGRNRYRSHSRDDRPYDRFGKYPPRRHDRSPRRWEHDDDDYSRDRYGGSRFRSNHDRPYRGGYRRSVGQNDDYRDFNSGRRHRPFDDVDIIEDDPDKARDIAMRRAAAASSKESMDLKDVYHS